MLRDCKETESSRTQFQVFNETQIKRNQKFIKIESYEFEVKSYPKKTIFEKPKYTFPSCHSCKLNNWIEIDRG